jgi:hypothetical protein
VTRHFGGFHTQQLGENRHLAADISRWSLNASARSAALRPAAASTSRERPRSRGGRRTIRRRRRGPCPAEASWRGSCLT